MRQNVQKKVYKNEQSIRIAGGLRVGYAGDIDPSYIDSIVDAHNNIEISIVRPYRSVDGLITKVSTNNIDDYYVIPTHIGLAKANKCDTHIYTVTPDGSDRKYYCYISERTYIVTSIYDDIIKLVNYDYAMALVGILTSWEVTNIDLVSYFEKDFKKIYKDLEQYINIDLPNHLRLGTKTFCNYWTTVGDTILHHTQGRVVRPKSKVIRTDNLEYFSRQQKIFVKNYVKIPTYITTDYVKLQNITIRKKEDEYEYKWTTKKGTHYISAKNRESLFLEVNKYINSQIERIIKEP